jgi:hypothetical protein
MLQQLGLPSDGMADGYVEVEKQIWCLSYKLFFLYVTRTHTGIGYAFHTSEI